MRIKVVLYNILNGFCKDSPPFEINTNRMNRAIEIIAYQKPDILILTEAYFWSFAQKVNLLNLRAVFKDLYNEYTLLAHRNYRWAPIVLSKYPINKFDNSMSKYQLNYMRANILVGKNPLMIDVFHPHPDTTEKQKAEFLKPIIKRRIQRYLLVGDFNALSPQDSYDIQKLVRGYESFMKEKGKPKVEDMLKEFTLKSILENNLIDTYKAKNTNTTDITMPTDLRSKNKESAIRVDYIFCTYDFKVLDSGIFKNKSTEMASDHYPIYATLEI